MGLECDSFFQEKKNRQFSDTEKFNAAGTTKKGLAIEEERH